MSLSHHVARMTGRDPAESHRASTPLELLFDLTFVVAFSQISSQTAHALELGHISTALIGFAFTTFAVSWAWINYSWLASAYDNDDVFFRIATLVIMIGVLVVALGVPPIFASLEEGEHLNNGVLVAGYVIMRISTVAIWLRAAKHDPARRRTSLAYAKNVAIAQVGWVALILLNLPIPTTTALVLVLTAFELAGPLYAELKYGRTPWHPHHIAERYGLLVIITLGEVILGTILAISAVVEEDVWTLEAGLIAFGGTALAFGMWWVYFVVPAGPVLARHPLRGFPWGYGHIFLFGSVIAVGSGLHVAAQVIGGHSEADEMFAVVSVAIPVLAFEFVLFALYGVLVMQFDPLHLWLFLGSAAVLALAVLAVGLGVSLGWALVIIACAPAVIVVGYETVGHRHEAAALERATE